VAISDAQRERVSRYQAERERYLAARAQVVGIRDQEQQLKADTRHSRHISHQRLILLPLAFLASAVAFDLVHLWTDTGRWAMVSYYLMAVGIVGGMVASVPALYDWTAIPSGTRAKAIGLWHGIGSILVISLFAASWLVRRHVFQDPPVTAFILGFAGITLLLLTGWLGGEVADRLASDASNRASVITSDTQKRRRAEVVTRPVDEEPRQAAQA
jgi:uncharacterized membrane protein